MVCAVAAELNVMMMDVKDEGVDVKKYIVILECKCWFNITMELLSCRCIRIVLYFLRNVHTGRANFLLLTPDFGCFFRTLILSLI